MTQIQEKKLWQPSFPQWLLVAAVVFLAIVGWLLKPESPEEKILKTQLQEVIIEQTGKKSNMDKDRIEDISVFQTSEGWNTELVLNADKGFTITSTKEGMWEHAIAILAPLSEIRLLNDISISWLYPVEKGQHDVKDASVMSFRLDKETRNQLIWEKVEPFIFPDIVLDYRQHPVLTE